MTDERGHDGLTSAERFQQMSKPLPSDSLYARIAALESQLATAQREVQKEIGDRNRLIKDWRQ